jgi:hypothetical protein
MGERCAVIFKRPGNAHVQIPLPEGGVRIKEWTGGLLSRGFSKMGVLLTLTTGHLLVAPLDMSGVESIYDALGKWVPGGAVVDGIADFVIEKGGLKDQAIIPIQQIVQVDKLNDASLLKPPAARVVLRDGSQAEFGFVASLFTLSVSRKNNAVRDDFIATMRPLLTA